MNTRARLLVVVGALFLASGCAGTAPSEPASVSPVAQGPAPGPSSGDHYLDLARMLHDRGVQVWFEADLVKRWLEGPAALQVAVARLGQLAAEVPATGFKIADELGYDDQLTSVRQATAFLRDARAALHRVAPHAQVLVDILVPQLGCPENDSDSCRAAAASAHPAATIAAVTSYLEAGLVDRLDLSTGLLDADAETMQVDQRRAWAEVTSLGWERLTTLQARKALYGPDGFPGGATDARDAARTYLDLPVDGGAQAVDIWTWRQRYDGGLVGILGAGLHPNALWAELLRRRQAGVVLFTHMTPSVLPTDPRALAHQCDLVAQVFGAVFVAAGTG